MVTADEVACCVVSFDVAGPTDDDRVAAEEPPVLPPSSCRISSSPSRCHRCGGLLTLPPPPLPLGTAASTGGTAPGRERSPTFSARRRALMAAGSMVPPLDAAAMNEGRVSSLPADVIARFLCRYHSTVSTCAPAAFATSNARSHRPSRIFSLTARYT